MFPFSLAFLTLAALEETSVQLRVSLGTLKTMHGLLASHSGGTKARALGHCSCHRQPSSSITQLPQESSGPRICSSETLG